MLSYTQGSGPTVYAEYTTRKRMFRVRRVPGRGRTLNAAFSSLGNANISLPLETNPFNNASGIPWFIACVARNQGQDRQENECRGIGDGKHSGGDSSHFACGANRSRPSSPASRLCCETQDSEMSVSAARASILLMVHP